MTWEMACRQLGVKRIRAVVKKGNKVSISSFIKAGFEKTVSKNYSGSDCVFFERNL
jgi:L-amino acid N-acyltransferase YncA